MTKRGRKAWNRAVRSVAAKGRNPIAEIDGYILYLENRYESYVEVMGKQRKALDKALMDIRKANTIIDKIEGEIEPANKPYYESNRGGIN